MSTYISRVKRYDTYIDMEMARLGIKTDKELAEKMGLTQQKLSYRLKDKISMDTLEKLSLFFGKSVKDLLR